MTVLLITAVLTKRTRLKLSNQDLVVNVTGGLRLSEPAADLGVALAVVSSVRDKPLRSGLVTFGELGLGGELRTVSQPARRAAEAARLGFETCIVPADRRVDWSGNGELKVVEASTLSKALSLAFEEGHYGGQEY